MTKANKKSPDNLAKQTDAGQAVQTDALPAQTAEVPAPVVGFANKEYAAGVNHPLCQPITVDGEVLKHIHVPRRSVGEMEVVASALIEGGSLRDMFAAYCGVHPAVLGGLCAEDAEALEDVITPFLPQKVQEAILAMKQALTADSGDS